MDSNEACRYHFLEDVASPATINFIQAHAPAVFRRARDPLNCLAMAALWSQEFGAVGVHVVGLGRQGLGNDGGFVLTSAEVVDHHFLAVGPELALFDPTAVQFEGDGELSPERYRVADGTPFPLWRARQLSRQR